MGQQPMIGQ